MKSVDCFCERDSDGQCSSCREKVLTGCRSIMGIFRDYIEEIERMQATLPERFKKVRPLLDEPCSGCTNQYMDLAMSKLILSLEDASENVAFGVMTGVSRAMAEKEITSIPLTKKIWSDLCTKKGWRP